MIWKLLPPVIIAYIGLKMIFSSFRKNKAEKIINKIKVEGRDLQNGTAVFCGTELDFDNAVFDGADLTAVFGGVFAVSHDDIHAVFTAEFPQASGNIVARYRAHNVAEGEKLYIFQNYLRNLLLIINIITYTVKKGKGEDEK
jgi:hypothetical protein